MYNMSSTRKIHRGGMKTKVKKGKGHYTNGGKSMKTKGKKGKGHYTKGGMKTKSKKRGKKSMKGGGWGGDYIKRVPSKVELIIRSTPDGKKDGISSTEMMWDKTASISGSSAS